MEINEDELPFLDILILKENHAKWHERYTNIYILNLAALLSQKRKLPFNMAMSICSIVRDVVRRNIWLADHLETKDVPTK